MPAGKPILEVNPEHALLQRLDQESDEDRFASLTQVLFDQARLAAGDDLEDAAAYVRRVNQLLLARLERSSTEAPQKGPHLRAFFISASVERRATAHQRCTTHSEFSHRVIRSGSLRVKPPEHHCPAQT